MLDKGFLGFQDKLRFCLDTGTKTFNPVTSDVWTLIIRNIKCRPVTKSIAWRLVHETNPFKPN